MYTLETIIITRERERERERVSSVANENDVLPTKPIIIQSQRHRPNAPVESIENHYRVNYCLS